MTDNAKRNVTAADLAARGAEDGEYLFRVFERYFDAGRWPVELMLSVFDGWCKIEVLSAEDRLKNGGLSPGEIATWRNKCVETLNARLFGRAASKTGICADAIH
jgi:hypothetical protein